MAEDALGKFTFYVPHRRELEGKEVPEEKSAKFSGVAVEVTSPKAMLMKKDLAHEVEVFSFTAADEGMHEICFRNNNKHVRRVNLEVETDLAVKDYSELVKKEHWRPLELQFRKAEDKLESISQELANSREREAELRQSGAEVANKIEWFSLLSITVLLTVSAWQMFYLKSFFRSKKLL
mmetsp:Transcript_63240/g.124205  ORF Transcript_63240/g.124205 Transcript_63240/m.124205 type:complete len:179 (+) Transcript_63240:171-707(+)